MRLGPPVEGVAADAAPQRGHEQGGCFVGVHALSVAAELGPHPGQQAHHEELARLLIPAREPKERGQQVVAPVVVDRGRVVEQHPPQALGVQAHQHGLGGRPGAEPAPGRPRGAL